MPQHTAISANNWFRVFLTMLVFGPMLGINKIGMLEIQKVLLLWEIGNLFQARLLVINHIFKMELLAIWTIWAKSCGIIWAYLSKLKLWIS